MKSIHFFLSDDIRCAIDFINEYQNTTNNTISVQGITYNDTITILCRVGYRFVSGPELAYCQRSGKWNLTANQWTETVCERRF